MKTGSRWALAWKCLARRKPQLVGRGTLAALAVMAGVFWAPRAARAWDFNEHKEICAEAYALVCKGVGEEVKAGRPSRGNRHRFAVGEIVARLAFHQSGHRRASPWLGGQGAERWTIHRPAGKFLSGDLASASDRGGDRSLDRFRPADAVAVGSGRNHGFHFHWPDCRQLSVQMPGRSQTCFAGLNFVWSRAGLEIPRQGPRIRVAPGWRRFSKAKVPAADRL